MKQACYLRLNKEDSPRKRDGFQFLPGTAPFTEAYLKKSFSQTVSYKKKSFKARCFFHAGWFVVQIFRDLPEETDFLGRKGLYLVHFFFIEKEKMVNKSYEKLVSQLSKKAFKSSKEALSSLRDSVLPDLDVPLEKRILTDNAKRASSLLFYRYGLKGYNVSLENFGKLFDLAEYHLPDKLEETLLETEEDSLSDESIKALKESKPVFLDLKEDCLYGLSASTFEDRCLKETPLFQVLPLLRKLENFYDHAKEGLNFSEESYEQLLEKAVTDPSIVKKTETEELKALENLRAGRFQSPCALPERVFLKAVKTFSFPKETAERLLKESFSLLKKDFNAFQRLAETAFFQRKIFRTPERKKLDYFQRTKPLLAKASSVEEVCPSRVLPQKNAFSRIADSLARR